MRRRLAICQSQERQNKTGLKGKKKQWFENKLVSRTEVMETDASKLTSDRGAQQNKSYWSKY
jgi:hypothetical protein